MKIFIARHAQSFLNVQKILNSHPSDEDQLTPLGKKQAQILGKKLKDKKISLIITSQLNRAIQTANIANREIKAPQQEKDMLLNDIATGFDGKSLKEYHQALKKQSYSGETFAQLYTRLRSFFEGVSQRSKQRILIVTHLDCMQALAGLQRGYSLDEMRNLYFNNGEYIEIDISKKENTNKTK